MEEGSPCFGCIRTVLPHVHIGLPQRGYNVMLCGATRQVKVLPSLSQSPNTSWNTSRIKKEVATGKGTGTTYLLRCPPHVRPTSGGSHGSTKSEHLDS
jgi:hypothetical protein